MASSKLHTCSLLFVTFVWITSVLCCKSLHPLLSNTVIHNSLSWVNSLTCMKLPGQVGMCVGKQLCDCSLRMRPSTVPRNPTCTIARKVGSSAAEMQSPGGASALPEIPVTGGCWVSGYWEGHTGTCLYLCLLISPALPRAKVQTGI